MDRMEYQNGKVYRIDCLITGECYIGSTNEKTLALRLSKHVSTYKLWKAGNKNFITSFPIIERGNYQITLIEAYPCNSRDELTAREGHFIRTMECVNKRIAGRTKEEYRAENKEKIQEIQAEYRATHKEEQAKLAKEWYEANKELCLQRAHQQRIDHKDVITVQKKEWYEEHKKEISEKGKEKYEANKERIKERTRKYYEANKEAINAKRRAKTRFLVKPNIKI